MNKQYVFFVEYEENDIPSTTTVKMQASTLDEAIHSVYYYMKYKGREIISATFVKIQFN